MKKAKEQSDFEVAMATARTQYDQAIDRADQILENHRNEHTRKVTESAKKIAQLESDVEAFDYFERQWDGQRARRELHAAIQEHKGVVDRANIALKEAIEEHDRAMTEAGVEYHARLEAAIAPSLPAKA